MRINIALLLTSVLSFSSADSKSSNSENRDFAREALEECSANSQAGMRDCLLKKVDASSNALIHTEKAAISVLNQWDEESKFVAKAGAHLHTSSRNYLKYRDAQCSLASALGGGAIANALELRRLACIFSMNTERTQQLTRLFTDLPRK